MRTVSRSRLSLATNCLAGTLVALLLCAGAARALPDSLKKQLHKYEEYKILVVTGKNPAQVLRGLTNDTYRIVVWQALPEHTTAADTQKVLHWVENGGILWFQDCRVASFFGMEADPFVPEELRTYKKHQGKYGDAGKVKGVGTLAMAPPTRPHVVLTGVDAVQVFLMEVTPTSFSGVRQSPAMTPLLKVNVTSGHPASRKCVACIMPRGRGQIVFKPLLWPEQLSGGRFQANLLEFSAGFGVPDGSGGVLHMPSTPSTAAVPSPQPSPAPSTAVTPSPKASPSPTSDPVTPPTPKVTGSPVASASPSPAPSPAGPVHDEITMRDGRVLRGDIALQEFKMTTYEVGLSSIKTRFADVARIVFQEDGARDAVYFRDGKKVMGTVQWVRELPFVETNGVHHKLKKMDVREITIRALQKGR